MAELTPELYQQVRDLSRFKRDFTLDEIGRRAAIAAGIAGGMDPRAAQEYYLSQSPYRLTRSEFDSRLGQLMELAQLQARQEAAALRGDQAAARAVQSTQVALAKARADTNKAVAAAMAGSYGKGKVDRLQYLNEQERELLYGEDTAVSLQAEQLLRTANPGDPITTFLPGQSPVYKEIVDKVADLKGKSLERYLTKVAGLRGTTLDALKADLVEAAAGDSPWGSLSGDIEAKLEAVPGELTAIKEERAKIDRELRARMGFSPVAQLNAVNAAERTGRASGESAAPLAADVSLIQQALTEFPEEGPPIRMERERLQRGPEFQQFMEEFYGRSAEDRPFSDIEERMALRGSRMLSRKQARGERQEGRQRLGALRRGEEFVAEETVKEEPAETTEKAPSKSAQLNVPAAAEATTATGVGEQPDINAYSFTEFDMEEDPFLYRVTKDGEFQSKRRGAKNFIPYIANPYAEGGLVDKINAAAVASKKSDDRAVLEMRGDTFSPEVSKSIFEVDILTRPEQTPTVQDRARQRVRSAYPEMPFADPLGEDPEDALDVVDEPMVRPSGAVPMPRRMDEAVRQQQTREELLDPRTQLLEAPEEFEFEADTQETMDLVPGSEEAIAESAAQVAKAQTEVFDTPPENPMGTPLSDAPPTANEVLKTNLESAGIEEEVYGDGDGLVGESPQVRLENEKRKQLLRRMRP